MNSQSIKEYRLTHPFFSELSIELSSFSKKNTELMSTPLDVACQKMMDEGNPTEVV